MIRVQPLALLALVAPLALAACDSAPSTTTVAPRPIADSGTVQPDAPAPTDSATPPPVDVPTPPADASQNVPSVPVTSIPGHESLPQDTTHKEGPRLMPAETYIRSYLALFGGLAPLEVQTRARGADGTALFDSWNDYLAALGLPDYRVDQPRGNQTNALMMATFERLGVVLCDRAVERDLRGTLPVAQRVIFAFDPTTAAPTAAEFAARFDVLHRTFLGYPAALAETPRAARFFELYNGTVTRHRATGAAASRFTPEQAGWATVCYGLVRHPEFHAY